ncbi:MAG TPA: AraC family transcriptional regulator [Bacteroidia bacterium]|nr:AraC family transcriptional regulator [Bacteroidia bacterium]HNT79801.1 AraC family transcriptional regulator [Bacteroidia bacterium]
MSNLNNFNRIIDSLEVKFYRISHRKVINPVELRGSIDQKNIFLHVEKGDFFFQKNHVKIEEGGYYFAPSGQEIYFQHGQGPSLVSLDRGGFVSAEQREKYLLPVAGNYQPSKDDDVFSIIGFDVLIYGAIPFFNIIELPCFILPQNEHLNLIIKKLLMEMDNDYVGKNSRMHCLCHDLVIQICRVIYDTPELKKNLNKLDFLLDRRLVNMIQYIQDNLDKDLSNKSVASLAYVSKDYVGQFFKTLTGQNLQEYIENQRLERAYHLLKTTNDNVQEIAHLVGFKDPAYFSRRFKIKFGEKANQVRQRNNTVV